MLISPQTTHTPSPMVTPPTPPAYKACSQMQSITQETILHLFQLHKPTFTVQHAASRKFPTKILRAILNEDTGKLVEYRHLIKNPKYCTIWKKAYGKELGRLAQSIPGTVHGTNTIAFIPKQHVPADCQKDVTYGRICANFQQEKEVPH
jgi:hypothetical protein